jgi:hypothetical protein
LAQRPKPKRALWHSAPANKNARAIRRAICGGAMAVTSVADQKSASFLPPSRHADF